LSEKKPSLTEILQANIRIIIMVMSMPLLGMAIAIGLVIWQRPERLALVVGLILFAMVQYGLTIYILIKRISNMGEKTAQE